MITSHNKYAALRKGLGVVADHAGFELKEYLVKKYMVVCYEVIDFGIQVLKPADAYPDYVFSLSQASSDKCILY